MLRVIVKKAPPFVVIASPELYMTTIVYEISISKQSKKRNFFSGEKYYHTILEWISFYVTWCVFLVIFWTGVTRSLFCENCVTKVWRKQFINGYSFKVLKVKKMFKRHLHTPCFGILKMAEKRVASNAIHQSQYKRSTTMTWNTPPYICHNISLVILCTSCMRDTGERPLIFASSVYHNLLVRHLEPREAPLVINRSCSRCVLLLFFPHFSLSLPKSSQFLPKNPSHAGAFNYELHWLRT